ncbi:MAG TPA: Lrp/AsnC family transcriptional regulator [Gammaproteobacteria bacterium]|nr:Lrp/AsnC family transcriptional regulator [Gammaproteobacteria bacterium]
MAELDAIDCAIVNRLQDDLPVCERPYAEVAAELGIDEAELLSRLQRLLDERVLTRFGPLYDAERLGGAFSLVAMSVPEDRFEEVAERVNAFPEVAHNYRRDHDFNMWFVLATETPEDIARVNAEIATCTGLPVYDMPKEAEYHLRLKLEACP